MVAARKAQDGKKKHRRRRLPSSSEEEREFPPKKPAVQKYKMGTVGALEKRPKKKWLEHEMRAELGQGLHLTLEKSEDPLVFLQ